MAVQSYRGLDSLNGLIDHASTPMFLLSPDQDGQAFNNAWLEFTGLHTQSTRAGRWQEFVREDVRDRIDLLCNRLVEHGEPFDTECSIRRHDGEYRWFSMSAWPIALDNARLHNGIVRCDDIEERRLSENQRQHHLHMQQRMLDASVDCIKIIGLDGNLIHVNRSGCLALNVPLDSKFGMDWISLLPKSIHRRGRKALALAFQGNKARFAGKSQVPGCKPQYWDNILTPFKDQEGNTRFVLCVSREVTWKRESEKRLRIASRQDPLTGLLNRKTFSDSLKRWIKRTGQQQTRIGFLIVDLDHFKQINDSLGHQASDHLLRVIARRMNAYAQRKCLFARLGGDEFAIAIDKVTDREDVRAAAECIRAHINAPVTHSGQQLNCGMSIGCSLFPDDTTEISTLLRCADVALSELKRSGARGGIRNYRQDMAAAAADSVRQIERAHAIVDSKRIVARFDPRIRLEDRETIGVDVVMGWRSATTKSLEFPRPDTPALQDFSLTSRMNAHLQHQVLAEIRQWQTQRQPVFPVSFPVAPIQFALDNFAAAFLADLARLEIDPARVGITLYESALHDRGCELVVRALRILHEHGVKITLGGFAAGTRLLTNLRDYPISTVMLESRLIHTMTSDPQANAIVQAVCILGQALSVEVLACDVETEAQCAHLQALGCTSAQGPLFGYRLEARQLAGAAGSA